ncbi:hypothetical protein OS493_007069 [Desmophyllum pertusum]|uniref:Uncharacterized protein n=1 Tax=Desmophyllum pertusum TaxID=174260 RepID=A0A9W9ZFF8_9CNID|nr:hypothetical protein OS493_007069 [Desmophyllum pertusum]
MTTWHQLGPRLAAHTRFFLMTTLHCLKDCSMLGWNGTHADGKWTSTNVTGQSRIQFPLNPYGFQDSRRSFVSSYKRRDCDDRRATEASLSPGDTWAIFVR